MKKETKNNFKKRFVDLFGAFGYLFCSLQWLWAILLYFSLISGLFSLMNSGKNISDQVPVPTDIVSGPPSLSMIIFLTLFVAVMVAIAVYAFIKMPSTIIKTSKKVVNETAEGLAPLLLRAQHKKDTKKIHKKLTTSLILAIKIVLVVLPFGLACLSGLLDVQMLDYSVAMFISFWLVGLSIISFGLQYLVAAALAVKRADLW